MYSVPFTIKSAAHLCLATRLADYYCALPILAHSHGVASAYLTSPTFLKDIRGQCLELLPVALKLRNAVLYKDCMSFAMGPWSSPKYNSLEDKKLKQYGALAHHKIICKVLEVERLIKITLAGKQYPYNHDAYARSFNTEYSSAVNLAYTYNEQNSGVLKIPLLFRSLHSSSTTGPMNAIKASIAPLFKNNLSPPFNQMYAGIIPFDDVFFCLELDDEDLPWNISEREW
jgi:hypothetical protein